MKKPIIRAAILLLSGVAASAVVIGQDHDHAKATPPESDHGHAGHAGQEGHDDHDGAAKAHADEVKLTAAAIRQNDIRVAPAETKHLVARFVAPSRVAFDTEAMAHLGSAVSGRVTEIKVRTGDRVRKDDELVVVESPELGRAQSEFLQRRTEADVAAAAVRPAMESYERAKRLFDDAQGIAFAEVQKRDVEYRAAVGSAAGSKAALRAAENSLRLYGLSGQRVTRLAETGAIDARLTIRAPIDGKVVDREVTVGELVSPDKEKLLVLADTRSIWVLADVPEARLADVGVGTKVEVLLPALPGDAVNGEVSLVSSEIDPATRTARLRIVVQNPDDRLRPGMFATSVIEGKKAGAATLAVPEAAMQTVEGRPSVFVPVAGQANTFARREVVVGHAVGGYVPVTAGLAAGDAIAVSGAFILKAELGKSEAGHEH